MTRILLLLLGLIAAGCLTRTDVGAEPQPDAGGSADAGGLPGGEDASAPSERTVTEQFAKDLRGLWQSEDGSFTLEFRSDGSYRSLNMDGDLLQSGLYFVTDQQANRRFRTVLLDETGQQAAVLRDTYIEESMPRVLKFEIEGFGVVFDFNLRELR